MPTEHYIYDGQNILEATDDFDNVKVTYTYEPEEYGELISQSRDGNISYYHYDAWGSTRELTDDSEMQTDSYIYTAWGETIEQTGNTVNPFRWIGKVGYYWDLETSNYYVRARYYQPEVGRWASKDPHGFSDGINLYLAYFVPFGFDPSGLKIKRCACSQSKSSYLSGASYWSSATSKFTTSNKSCQDICCSKVPTCITCKCVGTEMPLTPDEKQVVKCCKGDSKCQSCLLDLMSQVRNTTFPSGNDKCFKWLDNFLSNYPGYDPWGPIGKAGKVELCGGKITLEPFNVPIKGKKEGKVQKTKEGGIFIDHGIMEVTIGDCSMNFDIGSRTNLGHFGREDHWFCKDDCDYQSIMDLPNKITYVPTDQDVGN